LGVSSTYNRAKYSLARGLIKLDADAIGVLLVSSAYAFNADHVYVSDLTNELSGIGYVRQLLAGKTVIEDVIGDVALWKAADVIWAVASFGTPDAAIFYLDGTIDSSRQLICSVDISPKAATNGNSFKLLLSSGIMVLE